MAGSGNVVDIEVTGDETISDTLEHVADSAEDTARDIARSMGDTEQAFDQAARASGKFGEGLDMASGAASQFSGGLGDVGGAMTAFADLQDLAENKALEHEQALLDVEDAQNAYNDAVAKFGEDSLEARKAQAALNQAQSAAEPPTKIAEWGEKLEMLSPIIMAAAGAADLMALANTALNASFVKSAATQIAAKTATIATTAATGIATAAQWAWNIAMTANPIGLIIAGIVLLIGVIILIATKTTWFQQLWNAIWGAIKDPVVFVANFIWSYWKFVFNLMMTSVMMVKDVIVFAFKFAVDFVVGYFKFVISIPGRVIEVFKGIANGIFAPFKWAFNAIANGWNQTVGRLSFTIPSWVPGIGGNGFSIPKIPSLAVGGDVLKSGLAMIHAGERIQPAGTSPLGRNGMVIELKVPASGDPRNAIAQLVASVLQGGLVQMSVNGEPVRVTT